MNVLVVEKLDLNMILAGVKSLYISGEETNLRGIICLGEDKSGYVSGFATMIGCFPMSQMLWDQNKYLHRVDIPFNKLPYEIPYAWALKDPMRFSNPVWLGRPLISGKGEFIDDQMLEEHLKLYRKRVSEAAYNSPVLMKKGRYPR